LVDIDGDAHAVYYADFSPDHRDRSVRLILSLGDWGGWSGGKVPKKRVAFALRMRASQAEYQTTVIDARETPWHDVQILGRMLDRETALTHAWIQEVFRIADRIVEADTDVKSYLDGKGARKHRPSTQTGSKSKRK
jgi:hypothetical protein